MKEEGGFTVCDIESMGPVFNPLQDPHVTATETRGTIEDQTVAAPDANGDFFASQASFMQNLGGENSLIGRSISLTGTFLSFDFPNLGCCNIGLDAPPTSVTQT